MGLVTGRLFRHASCRLELGGLCQRTRVMVVIIVVEGFRGLRGLGSRHACCLWAAAGHGHVLVGGGASMQVLVHLVYPRFIVWRGRGRGRGRGRLVYPHFRAGLGMHPAKGTGQQAGSKNSKGCG
jgi:hypothetical protein